MRKEGEILIVLYGPGASEKVCRDFGAIFDIKTQSGLQPNDPMMGY